MERRRRLFRDVCSCCDRLEAVLRPDDPTCRRDPPLVESDRSAAPAVHRTDWNQSRYGFSGGNRVSRRTADQAGARSTTPDVFMFYGYGLGISSGWLEPLSAYYADRSL